MPTRFLFVIVSQLFFFTAVSAGTVTDRVVTSLGELEVSLATFPNGVVIPNQLLYVHGDQEGHKRIFMSTTDARESLKPFARGIDFGVIMRPVLAAPNIRTPKEVAAVGQVFEHLADKHGFTKFRVIAPSGAFPVVHGVAETRSDFECIIGASPVGDQLTMMRHINPNTSKVWADRYHDPIDGIEKLSPTVFVGITHDPRDDVVVIESPKLYIARARELGRQVETNLSAKARDRERHTTLRSAVKMYKDHCLVEGVMVQE